MEREIYELLIKYLHSPDSDKPLKEVFSDYHPYDIASAFTKLNDQERQSLYDIIDEETLGNIFSYLDESIALEYLKELSYKKGASVLNEMPLDDAIDIIKEMDEENQVEDYLSQMPEDDREIIEKLSTHEEDSAGSIMTTNFISISSNIDVKVAMKELGKKANDAEVVDPIFVVNSENSLLGVLSLKELIIARSPCLVDDIMNTMFISCNVSDSTVDVAKKIRDYDIYALPILDNGKLEGIVTMDDAIDIATDEIAEDYNKMAGVVEEVTDNTSMIKSILSRIPWLVLLLAISLLISNITSQFEDIIKKITILWFFNTMILDMAGNVGTQTLAVSVRKLGRDELSSFKLTFKFLGREILTNFFIGVLISILSFAVSFIFIKLLGFDKEINILVTCLVISSSLFITMIITGLLGCVVPVFLNKIKIDPAVASGPLITTLNDIVAIVVYFGLASIFMNQILL